MYPHKPAKAPGRLFYGGLCWILWHHPSHDLKENQLTLWDTGPESEHPPDDLGKKQGGDIPEHTHPPPTSTLVRDRLIQFGSTQV